MTSKHSPNTASRGFLSWTFNKGNRMLLCDVVADRGRRSFGVQVVPLWNLPSSTVERFDTPSNALCRHAEISRRLRESGWVLATRG
jgi:hypothetical protein